MSFLRNPLIPTWNCDKGMYLEGIIKRKIKNISGYLSKRDNAIYIIWYNFLRVAFSFPYRSVRKLLTK